MIELEIHQRHNSANVQDDHKFPCDQCGERFQTISQYQEHTRTLHHGGRSFACRECGKTFSTSSGLKQHTHIHSSVKPFQCEVCLKAYTQFSNLCRHKRMHASCRQQIKCRDCGQSFSTVHSLSKHKRFCEGVIRGSGNSQYGQSTDQMPNNAGYTPPNGSINNSLVTPHLQAIQNAYLNMMAAGRGVPSEFGYGGVFPHRSLPPTHPTMWESQNSIPHLKKMLLGKHDKFEIRHSQSSLIHEIDDVQNNPHNAAADGSPPGKSHNKELPCQEKDAPQKYSESDDHAELSPEARQHRRNLWPKFNKEIETDTKVSDHNKNDIIHKNDNDDKAIVLSPPIAHFNTDCHGDLEHKRPSHNIIRPIPKLATEETPLDLTVKESPQLTSPRKTHVFGSVDTKECDKALTHPDNPECEAETKSHDILPEKCTKTKSLYPEMRSLHSAYPVPNPVMMFGMDREKLLAYQNLARAQMLELNGGTPMGTGIDPAYGMFGTQLAQSMLHQTSHNMNSFMKESSLHRYHNTPYSPGYMRTKDKYVCKFCGKNFPRSANLTRHLRTHTGEQPYKCKYCERSFSISSNLQRHIRNIHNKEKPFRCPICDRSFGQHTNLERHMKSHEANLDGSAEIDIDEDEIYDSKSNLPVFPSSEPADIEIKSRLFDALKRKSDDYDDENGYKDNESNNSGDDISRTEGEDEDDLHNVSEISEMEEGSSDCSNREVDGSNGHVSPHHIDTNFSITAQIGKKASFSPDSGLNKLGGNQVFLSPLLVTAGASI